MEKAREFILKVFRLLSKPEMRILPGHLAFFLVMTIIPLVALITTIAAALSISTETIRQAIMTYAPAKVATVLKGKHKATYTPHVDCGDYVIIVNAEKVNLTGNKLNDKMYYNHSGYVGGLRERNAKTMIEKYPEEMIERAIKGMLPKGRLGRQMYKKLFVYAGPEHKQEAQKPIELKVD